MKIYILNIIGAIAGVVSGYFYWRYIGCTTGSCPLLSSPYLTMIWGGVFGWLLFSIFNRYQSDKKSLNNKENEK